MHIVAPHNTGRCISILVSKYGKKLSDSGEHKVQELNSLEILGPFLQRKTPSTSTLESRRKDQESSLNSERNSNNKVGSK